MRVDQNLVGLYRRPLEPVAHEPRRESRAAVSADDAKRQQSVTEPVMEGEFIGGRYQRRTSDFANSSDGQFNHGREFFREYAASVGETGVHRALASYRSNVDADGTPPGAFVDFFA